MRVVVISPGVVHAVPRTVAIASHFRQVDFVDVSGNSDDETLLAAGVRYHKPANTSGYPMGAAEVHALLTRLTPDVVVCHFASGSHFFNAVAWGQAPIAAIAMGQDVLYDKGDQHIPLLKRLLIRMGLRRCTFVAAKSQTLADRVKSYGVDCPVQLNYWGSDLSRFQPKGKASSRAALELPQNRTLLLSPRAIEPRLNIDLIVRATAELRHNIPNILLVLIGRHDARYLERIRNLIVELELQDNVLERGQISQSELPLYYSSADVVVSLASSEGFPNTALEVLACQVPLLIGELPQIDELLTDQVHCRICAIETNSVATVAREMLQQPDSLQDQTQAGLRVVQEAANISANGERFAKALLTQLAQDVRGEGLARLWAFRLTHLLYRLAHRLGYG